MRELLIRADAKRILIVAPGSLVEQWQDEMAEKFGLDFTLFSWELVEQSRSGNPFEDIDNFVLKIKDVAKKEKSGHIGEFRVRFPAAYNGIALIYDNVNIDEIGKYR